MQIGNPLDISSEDKSPLAFANAQNEKNILRRVVRAVDQNDTLLAFQPIVKSAEPNSVFCFEALVRIREASGQIIPASKFMPLVEELEIARTIDCHALALGLRRLRDHPNLYLSINMSARSIGYHKWTDILSKALQRTPSIGKRLILEITEGSAMRLPEIVIPFMRDLSQRGVGFALDDFGSGATSFRYLKDFQFDFLKIDGQFIKDVEHNADHQVLVHALLSIAHHFGMYTIAEAVETSATSAWLNKSGVICQQGYFFGRPTLRLDWPGAEIA